VSLKSGLRAGLKMGLKMGPKMDLKMGKGHGRFGIAPEAGPLSQ
jgi:hypothetical protein